MGIHVAYIFLRKNGWLIDPLDSEEIFHFPISIAAGTLTLEETTKLFRTNSTRIK